MHIGESVTKIGSGAFIDCSALRDVYIGSSVTEISSDAFYGTNICDITYNGTEHDWNNLLGDDSQLWNDLGGAEISFLQVF